MRVTSLKKDEVQKIVLTDDDDSDMEEPDALCKQPPSMLDMAFVMDCTASMQPYIDAVKDVSKIFFSLLRGWSFDIQY